MLFRKQYIVVQQVPRVDEGLKRLSPLCTNLRAHPLPVVMKLLSQSMSDSGQPMVVFDCPWNGCNHRQGWVRHRRTGEPFRLWGGPHRSGRH